MANEGGLLVLKDNSGEVGRWTLTGSGVSIGRLSSNDIVLESREVSRHHAKIVFDGRQYIVVDSASTNGTFLNGHRLLSEATLRDGDTIHIPPNFYLTFSASSDIVPAGTENQVEPLALDNDERRVWIYDEELEPSLSPSQFALLRLLSEQCGRAFSRREIVQAVWSDVEREGVSDAAIDALVSRLRSRLAEINDAHQFISVVRGYGFKLDLPGS